MGTQVLMAKSGDNASHLRVYAHCTRDSNAQVHFLKLKSLAHVFEKSQSNVIYVSSKTMCHLGVVHTIENILELNRDYVRLPVLIWFQPFWLRLSDDIMTLSREELQFCLLI